MQDQYYDPYYGNPNYGDPYYQRGGYSRQQMRNAQMPTQQNSVQWVSSEMEARNYLVAPNSAVALWDSSAPRVYLKQADASGKPIFKAYDLVERADAPTMPPAPLQDAAVKYVTRDEFDALAASVRELAGKKKSKEDVEHE